MDAILPPSVRPLKPQFLSYETIDDRREVVTLLGKLSPAELIGFQKWCCKQSTLTSTGHVRPQVSACTFELAEKARWDSSALEMLIQDTYKSLWQLNADYYFNVGAGLAKLVEMVRERHGAHDEPVENWLTAAEREAKAMKLEPA